MLSGRLTIDFDTSRVEWERPDGVVAAPFEDPDAFRMVADAYLRLGWDHKQVYGFTWAERPVIQLPDDLIRLQEAFWQVRPDVVVDVGVAHGGTSVFFASLMEAVGRGRVVGVDIDIRAHNRQAIETHAFRDRITLVEGDSVATETLVRVRSHITDGDTVMVLLDGSHDGAHVAKELRLYGELVTVGSYLVAADGGIMGLVVGGPRTQPGWADQNPTVAVESFVAEDNRFIRVPPPRPFDEGSAGDVSYMTGGWVRRVA